ncbi:hypothetical protein [Chryseobacterium sp.]|uniref:hypothetical protein n=1 Tax=Chryseobacterium sp. TaxID=1871047 RepID=UPI0035ADAD25
MGFSVGFCFILSVIQVYFPDQSLIAYSWFKDKKKLERIFKMLYSDRHQVIFSKKRLISFTLYISAGTVTPFPKGVEGVHEGGIAPYPRGKGTYGRGWRGFVKWLYGVV